MTTGSKTSTPTGWDEAREKIVDNYRGLLRTHISGPEVTQNSEEGQRFRFDRMLEIGNLTGKEVLDVGCGLADLYPRITERFGSVFYHGIDIVPEMVASAAERFPDATFNHRDILVDGLERDYDYAILCGVFNNKVENCTEFMTTMLGRVFPHCRMGMAFNFTSTRVNFTGPAMAYHDPIRILEFCLDNLSWKVDVQHHYRNCDVAFFVYQ